MPDSSNRDDATKEWLTLDELCAEAGVTVRTVRYYISEGLLPPPEGHSTTARYGKEHRDRLALIAALKAQYLPLREIRRTLDTLSPDQIADSANLTIQEDDAVSYLRAPTKAFEDIASEPPRAVRESSAAEYIAELRAHSQPDQARPSLQQRDLSRSSFRKPAPAMPASAPTTWRRIPITSDAELLITDAEWNRRGEQLETLITWARRMLQGS